MSIPNLTPAPTESLDELLTWFKTRYTQQLIIGSGVSPARMDVNRAVIEDAISSYRSWREMGGRK